MTLVELLMALSILAVVSTAVVSMLHAGAQESGVLTNAMSSQWEVEAAIGRIVQEGRVCTSLSVPTGVSGGTAFSLVTEPDPNNNNTTYTISYALATVNGVQQLQETDSRYGTSTLLHNVQSFNVRTKNAGAPQVVIIALTAGNSPAVARTFRITPRNQ